MKSFYETMLNQIRKHHLEQIIVAIAKYSPYILAIIYLMTLLYLFIISHELLLLTILKPFITFIFVTVLRKFINRPRPCIAFQIQPLIGHKQYQSFPSRHSASAFAIAFALFNVNFTLGLMTMILAFIVSLSRIFTGVHFISDVIASFIISFLIFII